MEEPFWYENAFFYGMDIRRFQDSNDDGFGDLPGLISRLDYLKDLGVDALWLLPFFDTPLRDNGYDIRDYYRVDPRVGTLEDFTRLVEEAHRREIRLVIDLVMNHTSDQHPWFQASRRAPASRYHDYYVWAQTPPPPQPGMEPIFPGEEESVWTRDALAGAHYFHRFYHFQPDLRIANPEVQEEIYKAIDFWLAMDVDGFRFDAAPLMIQAKGFQDNKPEDDDHLLEELHRRISERKRDGVLLAEANVDLPEMDKYFGGGSKMNMLFNFLFGPHVLLALARGSARPIRDYLKDIPKPPEHDEWLNFLRNHDELSLEKMPDAQNQAIYTAYAPQEDMKIYNRGIRRRIVPMLSGENTGMHREKTEMAYSMLFSAPGAALLMYGDEIGMGEDLSLPARNSVRTPMQWSAEKNAGFSNANGLIAPVIDSGPFGYQQVNVAGQLGREGSFLQFVKKLVAVRKTHPEIGICPAYLIDPDGQEDPVLVHSFEPVHDGLGEVPLIFFHNFTERPTAAAIPLGETADRKPRIRIGRGEITAAENGKLSVNLPAYGYLWVQI